MDHAKAGAYWFGVLSWRMYFKYEKWRMLCFCVHQMVEQYALLPVFLYLFFSLFFFGKGKGWIQDFFRDLTFVKTKGEDKISSKFLLMIIEVVLHCINWMVDLWKIFWWNFKATTLVSESCTARVINILVIKKY